MTVKMRFYDAAEENAKKRYGYWDCELVEIGLSERLHPSKMHDALIHEIVHAIFFFMNHGRKLTEEHVCDLVGKGLSMVLMANPKLMEWLMWLSSPKAVEAWVQHPGYTAQSL